MTPACNRQSAISVIEVLIVLAVLVLGISMLMPGGH